MNVINDGSYWVVGRIFGFWVKSHIIIIFYLDFHCGEIRFGHIISLLSVPFYFDWLLVLFIDGLVPLSS